MAAALVNGPFTAMYSLKPYYNSSDPVELPDCMYKMASLHGGDNQVTLKEARSGEPTSELVSALEKRQDAILQRLSALKGEVDKLSSLSVTTTSSTSTGTTRIATSGRQAGPLGTEGDVIEDLVINANPSSPPLSLLVLKELLSQQYRILGKCHMHSSAESVGKRLQAVFGNNNNTLNRRDHQMAFTLIWKDVKHGPTLMVSPKLQSAIVGEASIARYLARLLKPGYDSADDITTATEIDHFVDMAYPLVTGTSKEKALVLKALNAKLGKADWLVGAQLSLADIVLWSALQQSGQTDAASANIKRWLARCNQQTAFQSSLHLLQG